MTPAAQSLLAELDTALGQAPDSWRRTVLRRIADLFLGGAELYTDDQVALFGDVMCRLIQNKDRAILAELSNRLASVDNAPVKVIGTLARHDDVAIHGPILEHAQALPDEDLVEIADRDRTDLNLLLKIAARPRLSEAVTDILLKRGNATIQRKIVDNPTARMSETGFARLLISVNGDKGLAAAIAARKDVPAELQLWLARTLSS